MIEDSFSLGASLPVGDHLFFVSVHIFLGNGVALLVPRIQDMKIFNTMTG